MVFACDIATHCENAAMIMTVTVAAADGGGGNPTRAPIVVDPPPPVPRGTCDLLRKIRLWDACCTHSFRIELRREGQREGTLCEKER